MIQSTFLHLPGIGAETEEKLWRAGCRTWDDLKARAPEMFGPKRAERLIESLSESLAAYQALSFAYFHERLISHETWRLAADVIGRGRADGVAYLDIETTGLGFPPAAECTTLAVYWGGELMVEHEPSAKRRLVEKLDREADLLVTFNGASFDLPFLRREFNVPLRKAHLDLRFWFRRLGHRGGLKAIQTRFPDVHQRASLDIDGYDAVRLWRLHLRGVPNALETLKTYNAEDAIVLEQLTHLGFELESKARPHLEITLHPWPEPPTISTSVCEIVYRMLRH